MVTAVGLFAIMDAIIKWLGDRYPVPQIAFFRSLFAFLPLLPLILRVGPRILRTKRPMAHMLRSGLGFISMLMIFQGFVLLPLAQAVTLGFAAPMVMTALSVPILKEQVGWRRWMALAAGFVGVVIVANPGGGIASPAGVALVLGSAILYGIAMIALRGLGKGENGLTVVFYFTLTGTIGSALLLPWNWVTPLASDWPFLIAAGILGGLAQLGLTAAFRAAPIAVVAPFEYLALPFAALLGFLVWAHLPGANTLIGGAVIVASGLYILHRETRRKRPEASVAAPTLD